MFTIVTATSWCNKMAIPRLDEDSCGKGKRAKEWKHFRYFVLKIDLERFPLSRFENQLGENFGQPKMIYLFFIFSFPKSTPYSLSYSWKNFYEDLTAYPLRPKNTTYYTYLIIKNKIWKIKKEWENLQ